MVVVSFNLATGLLLLLLAVWVLLQRPEGQLNRTLGFLLLFLAGGTIAFGRLKAAGDPAFLTMLLWYEVPGLFVLTLFLDQYFFDEPRSRLRKGVLAGVGGLVLVMIGLLALRDFSSQGPLPSPFGIVYGAGYPVLEGVAIVLAGRIAIDETESTVRRRQAALVGLAMTFLLGHSVGRAVIWADPSRAAFPSWVLSVKLALAPVVAYGFWRLPEGFEGAPKRVFQALLLLPVAFGVLDASSLSIGMQPVLRTMRADTRSLMHAAFAISMALAIMRYGLAGIVEDAQQMLVRVTSLTLGLTFAGLASAAAFTQLGLGPRSAAVALGALAVPLALARTPLRGVVDAMVDRMVLDPGSPEVLEERARIYRSAVERALGDDDTLEESSQEVLSKLRHQLNLSQRDHSLILAGLTRNSVSDLLDEEVLGRYVLQEKIGEGVTARVYRAEDTVIGRTVVVKRIRLGENASKQLAEEMQALGKVQHPNVVTLYTADSVGSELFLVLEHCPNGSLADRLEQGPLDLAQARRVFDDLLDALGAVHAAGLAHGDVKPGNVLFDAEDRVKLGDFGSARTIRRDPDLTVSANLTAGSLSTMAPEQLESSQLTAATDVYAVAALLYRCLTGQHYVAMETGSYLEARRSVLEDEPRLDHPAVPEELEPVLARALAKEPAERYQTVDAFAQAVDEALRRLDRARAAPTPPRRRADRSQ